LGLDPCDFARPQIWQRLQEQRNKGAKIGQTICPSSEDDNRERQIVDTLLKREVAIDRDERIELSGCTGKQGAVLYADPAKVQNRQHFVAKDIAG
jgi:hypothetical protein